MNGRPAGRHEARMPLAERRATWTRALQTCLHRAGFGSTCLKLWAYRLLPEPCVLSDVFVSMCTYIHACMHACMHTYMLVYTCTYIYIYTHIMAPASFLMKYSCPLR